ncbi:MAG: NAD(P)/FAD-dependent oxidoreductase [Halobacteriota archaeon]
MSAHVVVLGGGYAGCQAVKALEKKHDGELTWINEDPYHLVLHESHRIISNPAAEDEITIDVDDIKSDDTAFVEGRVVGVDVDERTIELESGDTVDYDYVLVCLGSRTAFYGIPGLEEHSHTLKSLDDAKGIHEDVVEAAEDATEDDPADVVVGGAGLSGIQSAGEVAEYRDEHDANLRIYLVEGMETVLPGASESLQDRLADMLVERGVKIMTGDFIGEVDDETVYVGEEDDGYKVELDYDVLIWTGGVTGPEAAKEIEVDRDERSNQLRAGRDFTTSDERVFALGDCALVDQNGEMAPPTAQAAWMAADVAADNVVRAIDGRDLREWTYKDKGTLISVGEDAVAHDVVGIPVETFGWIPARFLKKMIAARWIAGITSWGRALGAWSHL